MKGGGMIDLSKYPQFNHIVTLKETSRDEHDSGTISYMTDSKLPVINFDDVKNDYIKDLQLSDAPKSNDALLDKGNGKLVFVEFKNGYMDRAKQFAVRKKIYDSTLIFTDILSIGISDMRTCVEYILVYNKKANENNPDLIESKNKHVQPSLSFDYLAKELGQLAKEEYVHFGVKMFEKYCFEKVHTYNEEEFERYLKRC